jgi:ferritin
MFSEKIQAALNDQINMELSAFYTYLSMSAYFEHQGLQGFAHWMRHHASEEMAHAMKIYDYVGERRGLVRLQPLPAPPSDWPNALAVLEDALKHEQKVTASINRLVDIAHDERDHATASFLQWYVDEQVEEEAVVDAVINDLKRIGDYGPGLFILNNQLGGGESKIDIQLPSA